MSVIPLSNLHVLIILHILSACEGVFFFYHNFPFTSKELELDTKVIDLFKDKM